MRSTLYYVEMRKTLGKITVLTVLLATMSLGLFLIAVWKVDDAVTYEPKLTVGELSTKEVSAIAMYVVEVESGTEIVSKNKDVVLPIASVTKLLSASLFYEDTDLEATTSITWADIANEGEAGKLAFGDVYTHRELMYPLLLESSNDVASVIARVSPDILENMNVYVQTLGLQNTRFTDTSGLSPQNSSTAQELSTLSTQLYMNYPHIFDITKLTQFIGNNTGWRNNNVLVKEQGYKGGKHGFTLEADKTDVAFFDETLNTGQVRTFGYVVLGSKNILADITLLRTQVQQNVTLQ